MTIQSVSLPRYLPPTRLHSDAFREEPAITGLVRLFTPIPRSPERNDTQQRYGPPPPFRRASAYPGIDRPVSGLVPVIPGAFTPRPWPHEAVTDQSPSLRLPGANRLTSLLKQTPCLVLQNERHDTVSALSYLPITRCSFKRAPSAP